MTALVARFPGMTLTPSRHGENCVAGLLDFRAAYNGFLIEDSYLLSIVVPASFPADPPVVLELADRIPQSFHTHATGNLCLGSPTRLRLSLRKDPTLIGFVENCVVPYLYGHSFRERYRRMPFGELSHGTKGILEDLARLFNVARKDVALEFVRLAAQGQQPASQSHCPCDSKRLLKNCHGAIVDELRQALGKEWFAQVYRDIWSMGEAERQLRAKRLALKQPRPLNWRFILPNAAQRVGRGRTLRPSY